MDQIKYWIALERQQGIGPAHLIDLHRVINGSPVNLSDLFDISPDEIVAELAVNHVTARAISEAAAAFGKIETDYLRLLESGVSVVPFFSAAYPGRLIGLLENAIPPFLYTLGEKSILNDNAVAMLGDKDTSYKGLVIAYHGARELVKHGITINSGMASGAGITVHRAALENGGRTAAVLPYGFFSFKVPGQLKDSLDPDRMVFVSPFYPSTEYSTFNGYIRNRLICALSRAVFIIEAPEKEGVFEAAKSARKLNLPLFTAEYSEYPPNASGNPLIIKTMEGIPVRGKIEKEQLIPNMDRIIAASKFNE